MNKSKFSCRNDTISFLNHYKESDLQIFREGYIELLQFLQLSTIKHLTIFHFLKKAWNLVLERQKKK